MDKTPAVSPPDESRVVALERRVAELSAELARAEAERERAVRARDAVLREVLPVASTEVRAARRGMGRAAVVALLFGGTLVAGLWLALRWGREPARPRGNLRPASPARAPARAEAAPVAAWATRVVTIPLPEPVLVGRAALAPDGRHAAVGDREGTLRLYDLATDRLVAERRAHRGEVRDLRFVDPTRVVSGGADGTVWLWVPGDPASGRVVRRGGRPVRALAVASGLVAVAVEDAEVELHSLGDGAVRRLQGHAGWVRALAVSPARGLLASGGHDGKLRLWSLREGRLVRTLAGHDLWVSALAFSPDGRRLASGSFDRRVRLWDVERGTLLKELRGHAVRLTDLAFHPKGELLASASLDKTVVVWDVDRGVGRYSLVGHRYQVTSVAFDGSGRTVLTASSDGTLRLWPVPLPVPQIAARLPPPGEGEVTLRNHTTGERLRVRLLDANGRVGAEASRRLATFLRSGADDTERTPDPKLVRLLDRVAERFGRDREILLISGFRSPAFNALRTRQSKQVAKESRHMTGQAMDFRLEGVTINALHAFVKTLKGGGVGFYADSHFVHMDTGPVRYWSGE
ncbi:MAG: DUF882 domain-containing protein [Deltaproteobacteria bacterium]|nr:DUF882 domain-containing protein [Deltaproteobacteria bacterium]